MSASTRSPVPAREAPLVPPSPALLRAALLAGALPLLICTTLWLSLALPRSLSLDVGAIGSGDRIFLRGVYQPEIVNPGNPAARTYRWARGDAEVLLPLGRNAPAIFSADMHAAPQPTDRPLAFAMYAGNERLRFDVPAAARKYHILLPPASVEQGVIRLRFASPTVSPPGDDRRLAVALGQVGVRPLPGPARPALAPLLAEAALVGLVVALFWANGARMAGMVAAGLGATALLAGLNVAASGWMVVGVWSLLLVGATLAAASLAARRLLSRVAPAEARFARRLWWITLAGLGLRLIGVSAPGFAFNDLDIQTIFLGNVLRGEVFLFVGSHEFARGQTFYPSGPYTLALPLLLLHPKLPFALHIGAALADACGPPLLALVARELHLGRRAALIAAGLLAPLPVFLTAIWWGFLGNISGQMFLLLLLWLLLRYTRAPSRAGAALLFLSLCLVLLSHVGVLILTVTAGLLTLGLAWLRPRPSAMAWSGVTLAGLGALGVCALVYLSAVAPPMLASVQTIMRDQHLLSPERMAEHRAYLNYVLPVAVWRGMGMLPFLMLLPGIPLLLQRAERPLGRALVLGWLITPFIYVAVDYLNTMQVRYVYFIAPLCCLASAAALGRLWERPAGRRVALVALALIVWLGAFLWYRGAVLGIKMSLVPLTH
ncbi:MAG: hypothetical protein RMK84_02595 [Oscillochloridaceae bacterium]|nr:hypothetical protein [Chloroflexaceae bacterium]MDW8388992.1 hypothetical protein [Oscillochloridaceae bacterium]